MSDSRAHRNPQEQALAHRHRPKDTLLAFANQRALIFTLKNILACVQMTRTQTSL